MVKKKFDPIVEDLVKNHKPMPLGGKWYYIEPAQRGTCDGCYFINRLDCPLKARYICNVNGGNIFKLKED